MITVSNVSLSFDGSNLFSNVNLKFTPGNCYGIIGANGAGKSTFLKILCGELEPSTGEVSMPKEMRLSVLKQDHYAYDEYTVLDTVIMGNARLYEIMKQKDALYAKPDFSEEDGVLASELEGEFAELNGWEAEADASKLIQGLGLPEEILYAQMASLTGNEKVKVLLAQALFGDPEIVMMDEPTNHLDIAAIRWLEDFLIDYPGTVIVVSHDRHFLNNVCTHTVDIDCCKALSNAFPPTRANPVRQLPVKSYWRSLPSRNCQPLPAGIPLSVLPWTGKPAKISCRFPVSRKP